MRRVREAMMGVVGGSIVLVTAGVVLVDVKEVSVTRLFSMEGVKAAEARQRAEEV